MSEPGPESGSRGRVLVADDHPLIVKLLHLSFEDAGYEVAVETDGTRVAEVAVRARVELAVVDANMRPGDRFEALYALCALAPEEQPAIIVVSGDDEPVVQQRALEIGAKAFLVKPWEPDELLALAERLIDERRTSRAA